MGKHRDKDQEEIKGDGAQLGREIPKEEDQEPGSGKHSGGKDGEK
jgi:hypothetical protein